MALPVLVWLVHVELQFPSTFASGYSAIPTAILFTPKVRVYSAEDHALNKNNTLIMPFPIRHKISPPGCAKDAVQSHLP